MYISALAVIVGWVLTQSGWPLFVYSAAVLAVFQSFIVFYEEPRLQQAFGDEYTAYRTSVGRWLPRARR